MKRAALAGGRRGEEGRGAATAKLARPPTGGGRGTGAGKPTGGGGRTSRHREDGALIWDNRRGGGPTSRNYRCKVRLTQGEGWVSGGRPHALSGGRRMRGKADSSGTCWLEWEKGGGW